MSGLYIVTNRSKPPLPDRWFGMQWKPNLIREEKRLILTRIYWNRIDNKAGNGYYSVKLTISLCWQWRDMFVGMFLKKEYEGWIAWLCLLPCLPIRVHYKKSYGGRYV